MRRGLITVIMAHALRGPVDGDGRDRRGEICEIDIREVREREKIDTIELPDQVPYLLLTKHRIVFPVRPDKLLSIEYHSSVAADRQDVDGTLAEAACPFEGDDDALQAEGWNYDGRGSGRLEGRNGRQDRDDDDRE